MKYLHIEDVPLNQESSCFDDYNKENRDTSNKMIRKHLKKHKISDDKINELYERDCRESLTGKRE